ncbi:hypothetical protein HYU18_04215 [Candidatus Woesearchaeota archaeon]|nr:hypothetical protein [Candidatus Woesearchaeota archaeon]
MYESYFGSNPRTYASGHSGLEAAVREAVQYRGQGQAYDTRLPQEYAATITPPFQHSYETSTLAVAEKSSSQAQVAYDSQPVTFLNPSRPATSFIGDAAQIPDLIKEAFAATTGRQFPQGIAVTVAPRTILQQMHKHFFSQGVVGLSFNASREVFAVAGNLDEVMLVIGHELGHILSPTLGNAHSEEAKAFAFEAAWASAIFEKDIGGLRTSINSAALSLKPAQNGLHDLAFAFVKAATIAGKEPLLLHSELSAEQLDLDSDFNTQLPQQPMSYVPLMSSSTPHYHSGGYLNKSSVQNVPWLTNFSWADLGTGIYGMYLPMTASIFLNEKLLKNNLEQFHKTLGHEYILHHVMQLPDGYVTEILEQAIFWEKEEKDKYKK